MLKTGINLHIDSSISEICNISNKSSSQTRAVLYLVLSACFIQIIVFLNTYQYSWHNLKHEKEMQKIDLESSDLINSIGSNLNKTINTQNFQYLQQKKMQLERYDLENFELLRIPIINLPIHVNDTGLITGILLSIFFLILVFTLQREEKNLMLALNAISNRYTDDSDEISFKDFLDAQSSDINRTDLLTEINKTRRSYHYNQLTMNEIFTRPNLSIDDEMANKGNNNLANSLLNNKYYLAWLILLLTLIHDLGTMEKGIVHYSSSRTFAHYLLMILCTIVLFWLTFKCNSITKSILRRYNKFIANGYKFVKP